jgi:hypothetical protein
MPFFCCTNHFTLGLHYFFILFDCAVIWILTYIVNPYADLPDDLKLNVEAVIFTRIITIYSSILWAIMMMFVWSPKFEAWVVYVLSRVIRSLDCRRTRFWVFFLSGHTLQLVLWTVVTVLFWNTAFICWGRHEGPELIPFNVSSCHESILIVIVLFFRERAIDSPMYGFMHYSTCF